MVFLRWLGTAVIAVVVTLMVLTTLSLTVGTVGFAGSFAIGFVIGVGTQMLDPFGMWDD